MDRNKVIKGLECCASNDSGACAVCDWSDPEEYECFTNLSKAALELLKEQEPKQAKKLTFHVKTTLGYEKPIVATRYDWLCPTCESLLCRDIDVIDDNYHFCKVCGQAVKWE